MQFRGVFTALVTPFSKDNSIDENAFCELVEWQISGGVHGLVPCGTTGESSTLTFEEYCEIVELCVKTVNKQVPIIAGVGSNNTAEVIKKVKYIESVGADAVLVVAPYYNKPTQDGLYSHFKTIHDNTHIPIILYNVPGRCAVDISDVTAGKIMELERIIGIKDATGDLNRPLNLKTLVKKEISLLSGEDSTALAFNIHGGCGCISVTANIAPKLCAKLQNLFFNKQFAEAVELNKKLFSLNQVLFCEANPIPVKYGLSLLKPNIFPNLRLPLTEASEDTKIKVKKVMQDLNII
ncbi:4-hydroxy-tetrahydrodipicolinate synthase [Candidatus Mesenet endosymbiont of Phosphuga atrata]|uniref:4-hydroxy-tetrahydrodipicolinate synthase n=1 Tax=Candidatus Mesenet endosymbiont of Phosphuga atrata TaxID=3066221 RepID=UPI0030D4FAC1